MEPSAEEFRGFQTIDDIAVWTGMPGGPSEPESPRGAFYTIIGFTPTTHWRALAGMSSDDFSACLESWAIADSESGEETRP